MRSVGVRSAQQYMQRTASGPQQGAQAHVTQHEFQNDAASVFSCACHLPAVRTGDPIMIATHLARVSRLETAYSRPSQREHSNQIMPGLCLSFDLIWQLSAFATILKVWVAVPIPRRACGLCRGLPTRRRCAACMHKLPLQECDRCLRLPACKVRTSPLDARQACTAHACIRDQSHRE